MGQLAWQKSIPDYLCFTALESGTFTLTIPAAVTATYLSYVEWSKDGRTWNHTDNTSEAVTIDVQVAQGEKVYWRGSGASMTAVSTTVGRQSIFSSTARFDASGHLISLLTGDNLLEHLTNYNTDGVRNVTFARLFEGCDTIVNASDLILPTFTSWHTFIYNYTFYGSSLVSAPNLPSLDSAKYCYMNMFQDCKNLTSAPQSIAATQLETQSCRSMFQGCTSLTAASPMAVTTLNGESSMQAMYYNCTSLVTPMPSLGITAYNTQACYETFRGCSSLASMPQMTISSVSGPRSFYNTFLQCSSLTGEASIDVPSAGIASFQGMFSGTRLTKAYVRCPIAGENAFRQTFFNISTLADIDIVGASTLNGNAAYYSCFYGCRATRQSIVLPATTPTDECYKYMFYGNGGTINHITCLATDISATDCTLDWLVGASSTGIFIQAEGVTWPRGASGIPTGWVDVEKRTMPQGYKQVEYLLNPNLGAFNLQHVFDSANETIELQFVNTADKGQFLGTTNNGGYYGNISVGNSAAGSLQIKIGIGNATVNTSVLSVSADTPYTFRYEGNANGFKIYTNGNLQKSYTSGWDVQHTITVMYVYSNTDGQTAPSTYPTWFGKCPFIGLKVWDGNSDIIIDFVPCIRESDGLAGFYDFARTTFYYSLNGNDFTAGEEI